MLKWIKAMPKQKRKPYIRGLGLIFAVVFLLATLTGGVVYGAARSAHMEYWRYVSTIPSLDQMDHPVGRGLSLVRSHKEQTAFDIFPTHAVLFTLEKVNILLPEAVIAEGYPVTLTVFAVSEQGTVSREITEWEITTETLQIGEWLTIFESNTESISPEETLVIRLTCEQNMDIQIAYEVIVNIYDSENPLLRIFLPLILK
jgi:hypothetical protein